MIGGVLLATQSVSASTDTNTTTTTTTTSTADDNYSSLVPWNNNCMFFGEHRGGFGGPGLGRGIGGFGQVEVSTAFVQNVTAIAQNDTDVQNLLNQGYNITSVKPIIQTVLDANGYVTTRATTAIVVLQKDTSGLAYATVNLDESKVTEIVILTKTVIQKP